jgi:hypothetical protein
MTGSRLPDPDTRSLGEIAFAAWCTDSTMPFAFAHNHRPDDFQILSAVDRAYWDRIANAIAEEARRREAFSQALAMRLTEIDYQLNDERDKAKREALRAESQSILAKIQGFSNG